MNKTTHAEARSTIKAADGPAGAVLMSPRQTAAYTSLHLRTIRRQVAAGAFPAPRRLTGNRIAFLRPEVDAWIEALPRAA